MSLNLTTTRPLRVYVGMIAHETNTFSPIPTSLASFSRDLLHRRGDDRTLARARRFPAYGDALTVGEARGDTVIAGLAAWTQPSGPLGARDYAALRNELLEDLRSAGPVDAVFLSLHGAMVAEGRLDCDADILEQVRAVVGPSVPVGALLDLHGNVGPAMLASGALLVAVKEYPHVDFRERAEELYALLAAEAHGGRRLETVLHQAPVLGLIGTTEEPMRSFVEALRALEREPGIASASMMHGSPWADTPDTGAAMLVVTEASASALARAEAGRLANWFSEILRAAPVPRLSVAAALDAALATPAGQGPVVVADASDNPGGGAACDSTFILRALIERGVQQAAIGMIWDPQACALAAEAGPGAVLPLRIGGKVGPLSGDPLDVRAEVLCVRTDARQRGLGSGRTERLGLAVALRIGGVEVVLNDIRQQVFSPECFSELGIDPARKDVVVVKSAQHFRAAFDGIARRTIYCNAPGTVSDDLAALPYRHLRRPTWPVAARQA